MSKRISIQLVGSASDNEDVRLSDFIEKLSSVKKALRETEIAISGHGETVLDYKVIDLRHSSPFTVVLEIVSLNGSTPPALIPSIVSNFGTELKLIKQKGELLTRPDLARLQAYQDIGVIQAGRIEKVKIRTGRNSITLDQRFNQKLDAIVGPDEFAQGTIAGMLEAVNIHNTNRFTLYPPLGPKHISGKFPAELRPKVKEAIGGFVTVIGTLRYKAWAPYPHGIIAEDFDLHEQDSELPTLTDLRGAFAGSMGDLNSAEFIDRLRYEDW